MCIAILKEFPLSNLQKSKSSYYTRNAKKFEFFYACFQILWVWVLLVSNVTLLGREFKSRIYNIIKTQMGEKKKVPNDKFIIISLGRKCLFTLYTLTRRKLDK